ANCAVQARLHLRKPAQRGYASLLADALRRQRRRYRASCFTSFAARHSSRLRHERHLFGKQGILGRRPWPVVAAAPVAGDIGAAAVVTANPFVMELMRENFPA